MLLIGQLQIGQLQIGLASPEAGLRQISYTLRRRSTSPELQIIAIQGSLGNNSNLIAPDNVGRGTCNFPATDCVSLSTGAHAS
jgi:hypothetical protein